MHHFGVPRRGFDANGGLAGSKTKVAQVQWRRGLLRVWLLASAAWIMGWIVFLILHELESGFRSSGEFTAIPVLLIGPPIALLLFETHGGMGLSRFQT